MLNRLSQRILSLLLIFAMVLAFAAPAASATDIDPFTSDEETLVLAEEGDSSAQEEDLSAPAEEPSLPPQDEPSDEEPQEPPADESAELPDSASVAEDQPQAETPEQADATQEPAKEADSQSEESADSLTTANQDGWQISINQDGELDYSFTYMDGNRRVTAADGYFSIGETITVQAQGENYTFNPGIYSFDEKGSCLQELADENVNAEVQSLEASESTYVLSSTECCEISLGDVESTEENVVTSGVTLFTGIEELNGLYHSFTSGKDKGLYTGTFLHEDLNAVCYANDGELLTSTTKTCHWYNNKLYGFSSTKNDVAVGSLYTGAYKVAELTSTLKKSYVADTVYYFKKGKGATVKKTYASYNGLLYYFNGASKEKAGYSVGSLVSGYVSSKLAYYNKGKIKTSLSGWKKISKKAYYFKKGKAVTGWNYLKRNGAKYKYFFRDNGSLVEDLYEYFGKSYYAKKQRIYVNRYTNNITFYQYDSKTKKYDIPLRSSVCATSRTMNVKFGTYPVRLMARWYYNDGWYWQYLTYIGRTGALFHSCHYYKKNTKTMQVSNYNSMGRCSSAKCIRAQLDTVRLIYQLVKKQGNNKISCVYYTSKDKGPFGRRTVANTTGKLKGKMCKDPTD